MTVEYITTEQLSKRWGVTTGSLENQRRSGEGPPFIKLGPSKHAPVRYALNDIEEFESRHKKNQSK